MWNRIPDDVRVQMAAKFTNTRQYYVSEAFVCRLLKAHDLITENCLKAFDDGQALPELIVRMEREAEDTSRVVDGQTITDWLAWARRQLALSDPLSKGIANLFEEVAASAHAKD